MPEYDIRWKQRFLNFETAIHLLEQAMQISDPDIIYRAGIIQFYEMSIELAWKLLKDYLEDQGFADINSPRASIKQAFEVGIIHDGHLWMKALEDRNLTVHTYDEEKAIAVEELIRKDYLPLLKDLYDTLKVKSNEN